MTDHAEQVWAWLREPLQLLAQSFDDNPETDWDGRVRELLDRLGLGSPDEHPVAHALLHHLESLDDPQRREYLTSPDAELYAHEVANAQVVEAAPEEYPLADEAAAPDEQSLRELTDQAYQWVVAQLTEEDPDFPAQLEQDPGLAQAIYDEAAQRIGLTPAG